jgi:uncharacterized protein (TIGR00255 family)
MLFSMTGFGKTQIHLESGIYEIHIKSLNSKNADVSVKIPSLLREREIEIRKVVIEKLLRGKIDVYISHTLSEGETYAEINIDNAKHYLDKLKSLSASLAVQETQDYVSLLLKLPDVIQFQNRILPENEWNLIESAVKDTLREVIQWREQEGKLIHEDMLQRIHNIIETINTVEELIKDRKEQIHAKLVQNLSFLPKHIEIDTNRLEQEILYYLDKFDISEEIMRARTHSNFFIETMNTVEDNGKKLLFISQEILRELNTLGVKANDIDIQKYVVNMKDEIEKVREQLHNVL